MTEGREKGGLPAKFDLLLGCGRGGRREGRGEEGPPNGGLRAELFR